MTLVKSVVHRPDLSSGEAPKRVRDEDVRERPPPPPDPLPAIKLPTVVELATNFGSAMVKWVAAGVPTVTHEQYQVRAAACEPCPYWDASARMNLGRCSAPGCGCTSLKRWLATEECKHPEGSRWPALTG